MRESQWLEDARWLVFLLTSWELLRSSGSCPVVTSWWNWRCYLLTIILVAGSLPMPDVIGLHIWK